MGRNRPSYRLVDGMRMPMGFPAGGLASGMRYAASAGDIFVVSYPKSGTTWLQYIVYLLVRRRTLGADELLTDRFPHLEEVGASVVEGMPRPRLIKTHLRREMTPFSASARYIVIARNPFDCAVSFFHHTRGFPRHYDFAGGRFSDFFDCFIEGEVDFGDYFDHLVSWQAETGRDNVFFQTYEALKSDARDAIRRVAAFLGERAIASVSDDADLGRLIEATSLASMQRDQQRWSSKRPDEAPAFVRKGEVGDWRTLFTPDQTRALLAKFDRRLGGTPAADLWPDVLAEARACAAPTV